MVDSSDGARISEARNELHRILTNVKLYENALSSVTHCLLSFILNYNFGYWLKMHRMN